MFGAHLESIDREIGKFSQNSTIGLDGNIDQEKGHTNMKFMDRDYVDQPAKSDGECNAVKGVFNFQVRTEDQIKESSSGLEVSTTVVQHANADVLNGMEGVGPQEIKGLDSNTSLPNSAQQHDAISILSIPLSSCLPHNRLVWAYTPKGRFTIRSAYKLVVIEFLVESMAGSSNADTHKTFWRICLSLSLGA
nr:hypothetical protein CFP56_65389 [Quercus suber]